MGIDARFAIELYYVTPEGSRRSRAIGASHFFEFEEYDASEWDCDLPWRYKSLDEYLPPAEGVCVAFGVSIVDIERNRERKVHVQKVNATTVTLSWDDLTRRPESFELILDVPAKESSAVEIARVEVDNGKCTLATHLLIEGDSCTPLNRFNDL